MRAENKFAGSIVDTETDPSLGAALIYGARITRRFAIELDFEWIAGYELEQSTLLGTIDDHIVTYTLASSLAYHPIEARIDPFVSLGLGWMRANLREFDVVGNGLALRASAGTDIWLTDNVGVRLEGRYTFPVTEEIEDLDSLAPRLGILYRF
jgi:opacity protein-like surface antigen